MSSYYEKILATGEVKCIDEEVPFEIPQGWEWCRLFEVGKTETGTTPSKSHPEYFGDYIPFLGPANILNSKIVSVTQGLSDKGVYYGRIVPKNTILQVCIGGSIGKCAITDKPVTFNQQINSITPYLCNVEFVHIVLQSEYFRVAIMDKATGTATPIINRGNWETLLFPLPPISEQKRIVAKITELTYLLDIYSNKQEELNALNTNMYQRIKKSILQEAIQGKFVPQIAEEGTAHELLEHIKAKKQNLVKEGKLKKPALATSIIFRGDDNKYYEKIGKKCLDITEEIPFEIPASWAWTRLDQGISLLSGRDLDPSQYNDLHHGIPYITGASNFVNSSLLINRWTDSPMTIANKGDLLLTCKGTIGSMVFNDIGQIHIARQVMAITSFGIDLKYIKYFLQGNLSILEKNANSMIPGISRSTLLGMLFPLPPFKEQQRIVTQIEKLFEQLR